MFSTMPACHSNFQLAALTPVLTARATLIVVEVQREQVSWSRSASTAQHWRSA